MLEKVARAIYENISAGADDMESCIIAARKVLTSMREPSTRQLAAAQTAWLNDPERKSSTIYTAMIDAAILEPHP